MADTDGATQPGASELPDLNDPTARYDRATAMAALRQRRHETVVNDMDDADAKAFTDATAVTNADAAAPTDADTDPGDAAAEAERARLAAVADAAPPADDTTAQQIERQTLDEADLSKYLVRTKVRGVEQLVPLDELRDTAQKTNAGDTYLREARETLAEMKAMAGQVSRQQADPAAATATADPATSNTSSEPDPIDAAIDSLFQGDEAKAKQLLRQAVKAGTPASHAPDAGAIARQVEQTLVIRSALRQFSKDHADIAKDPFARRLADEYLVDELKAAGLNRLEEAHPDRVPDLLNAAGKRAKDYFRQMAGVPSSQPAQAPAVSPDRRAAKATLDELPTAATRAASTTPTPLTTSDVIARMQAARPHATPER